MFIKQRVKFYDKWGKEKSAAFDRHLYAYFSGISDVSGVTVPDGSKIPEGLFNYGRTEDLRSIRAERQQFAIFSKNVSYGDDGDKEKVAWNAFCESELNCKRVNESVRNGDFGKDYPECESIFYMARRKISQLLGDVPRLEDLQLTFGPGANTTVKKNTASIFKIAATPVCSKSFLSTAPVVLDELPLLQYFHKGKLLVGGGTLAFVPKDATKHRSIIIEPILNTVLQKGIGSYLKKRFKLFGIDLKNQFINRERARIGSITGHLATVDMSSASDNIAYNIVLEFLPLNWFEFMEQCRTSFIHYKRGKNKVLSFELEKFSTMGNGYTFELQSLLFYSIAHSCCVYLDIEPDVTVFGDDVILPSPAFDFFCRMLTSCGFKVNEKKSFSEGPFRESCGGDYVKGKNIRPFYVLDAWTDARLVSLLNFYYNDPIISPEEREYWLSLLSTKVPRGPVGYGDGHIHDEFFVGVPANRDKGHCGFTFKTFVMRSKKVKTTNMHREYDLDILYNLPYKRLETDLYAYRRPFTNREALQLAYALMGAVSHQVSSSKSLSSASRKGKLIKDPCVAVRGGGITKVIDIYYIPE